MDLRDLDVKRRQIENDISRVTGSSDVSPQDAKKFLEELQDHIELELRDFETDAE